MSSALEEASVKLYDQITTNSPDFDIGLLDQVVVSANTPKDPNFNGANQLLLDLKNIEVLWSRVDDILEKSEQAATKVFGLQVLSDAITTRWKVLPVDQREGIKEYIWNKINEVTKAIAAEQTLKSDKFFLNKLNIILVDILKQEWPHNWPSFIPDLVEVSRNSEECCENSMSVLKLLSEEVFEFSKESMTTTKTKNMKESLHEEFSKIYQLCDLVLKTPSVSPSLIQATLITLQRFLIWIPLGYVFETDLLQSLITQFFPDRRFRGESLMCLSEVAGLSGLSETEKQEFENHIREFFALFINQLQEIIPLEHTDFSTPWKEDSETDIQFLQRLVIFFTNFFKEHMKALETEATQEHLLIGLFYLVKISEVCDEEIFKICLEYWHVFSQQLYKVDVEYKGHSMSTSSFLSNNNSLLTGNGVTMGLNGQRQEMNSMGLYNNNQNSFQQQNAKPQKVQFFQPILEQVKLIFISRMAKPEEVLVVQDENGDVVREQTKDTETIQQYKTMREALVYMTHLNVEETEEMMLTKLARQMDGSEWTDASKDYGALNTLCWAIGSISGSMKERDEKRFLVTIIKDLLNLCENKKGKDNKAVIASNIMYVVGQYPRFLRAHWKFLRTVVVKLFEFMHEKHPGVQDMACDTFLKIATKCKRKFMTLQDGEEVIYIDELVDSIQSNTSDLENLQMYQFFEAVGTILSDRPPSLGQGHREVDRPGALLRMMEVPNQIFNEIMNNARENLEVLNTDDVLSELTRVLKINTYVCSAVKGLYIHQLSNVFLDMLNLYQVYSEFISQQVEQYGEVATRHQNIKYMRLIKKEILKLLTIFIERSAGEIEAPPDTIATELIPPSLDPILTDYCTCVNGARDPEVLALCDMAIKTLQEHVLSHVPTIMERVFNVTLNMINQDDVSYPEHRIKFYSFIKTVNKYAFDAILVLPPEDQKLVVDAIVWGFKHTDRNIADMALDILYDLLVNVSRNEEMRQSFYVLYLKDLLENILIVMTDRLHKSGFNTHAKLINYMLFAVAKGEVTEPLYTEQEAPIGSLNNAEYLNEYMIDLLLNGFQTLTRNKLIPFVGGLFDLSKDFVAYKTHLRDFLIDLKEFSDENNAEWYAEENAQKLQEQQELQMQNKASVPGLLNPYEVQDNNEIDTDVQFNNLQLDGQSDGLGNTASNSSMINSGQGY